MKHKLLVSSLFALPVLATSSVVLADSEVKLETFEQKYGYAIGTKVGEQLLQQFKQYNPDKSFDFASFSAGLNAVINEQEVQLTAAQADEAINEYQAKQVELQQAAAEDNLKKGEAFREEYAKKGDVQKTESGLLYRVLTAADKEGTKPTVKDIVKVHYTGTLTDGTQFDSSVERGEPAEFQVAAVIPGWTEILQLMQPGDKWEVVIPAELAYGPRPAGPLIGANETLIFDVELLEVLEQPNAAEAN